MGRVATAARAGHGKGAAMDERTWLEGESILAMIWHLRDQHNTARTKAGRRKLRLFVVACFRQFWEVLPAPARHVVELLEREADGRAEPGADPRREAEQIWQDNHREPNFANRTAFALFLATSTGSPGALAIQISHHVSRALSDPSAPHLATHPEYLAPDAATARRHADLLREVFGNPFRPPPKRKFPAELRGLAQACYDDPSHYPVLADALADLAEDAAAAHCREPGHVKGCHVVDWILGRG